MAVISRKSRAFAAFVLAAALLAAACSLEEELPAGPPPEEEAPAEEEEPASPDRGSLDPRLYGLWRFVYAGKAMEEFDITPEAKGQDSLGSLIYRGIYQSADLSEVFAGDIVYAANFSERTGVLIVEYWPDHKQVWIDWGASFYPFNMVPLDPQPPGNFYGLYFLRLNEAGSEVFLVCTNDQANNYGPTEALSLEEAVARFTEENREQWMHPSVGDAQEKAEGRE